MTRRRLRHPLEFQAAAQIGRLTVYKKTMPTSMANKIEEQIRGRLRRHWWGIYKADTTWTKTEMESWDPTTKIRWVSWWCLHEG
jgi:hypothetical protein